MVRHASAVVHGSRGRERVRPPNAMSTIAKRTVFSLSFLAALALGGCDSQQEAAADEKAPAGGKADDPEAPMCESDACSPALEECLQMNDAADCYRDHAGCLVASEGFAAFACDDFTGHVAMACESCTDVPECDDEMLGDAQDLRNCEVAKAECQWDRLGVLPGGCQSVLPDDASCDSPECLAEYDACIMDNDDDVLCSGELGQCLAVVESLPVAQCTSFGGGAKEACQACENLPECEVVEDGADHNTCQAAVAQCQWDFLRILPGACEAPGDAGGSCVSSNDNTFRVGSCTNSFQCMPADEGANAQGWIPRTDDAACNCEDRWDSQGGCP